MTEPRTNDDSLPARPRRWPLILAMLGIFVCGGIVGGAISRIIVRNQMLSALRNPGEASNRILPTIIHSLDLTAEQQKQVEAIVVRHFTSMESLRAHTYPLQLAEFEAMCADVDVTLSEPQRSKWSVLTQSMRQRYLPSAPVGPPPSDFLFATFDSNHDQFLEESEVPPRMWRRVGMADIDKDGLVSRPEYAAARMKSQQ